MAVRRRYVRTDFAEGALPRFGPGAAAITALAKLMRRDPSTQARGAARPHSSLANQKPQQGSGALAQNGQAEYLDPACRISL